MTELVSRLFENNNEHQKARDLALRRLNRSECSAHDMKAYMIRKGVDESLAVKIVEELIEQKLLDDARFTRLLARQHALRGKGPNYVEQKLRAKGIRPERGQLKDLLTEVTDQSEVQRARQVVERRYPQASTNKEEAARAYQALLRRGFSFETARLACSKKNEDE